MKVLTEIVPIALPMSWPMRRVRDVAILINGFPFKSEDFDSSGDIPLVRIRDLTACDFELYVPESVVPPQALMRNGDLAIGMDGDFNSVLWSRGPAALNQRVCILRPRRDTDIRFLGYVLPSVLKIINDLTYSTTVKHLSGADVLQQLIPFPEFKQQLRISQFLDVETAQIDNLIGKQERLIELLAEKRQAIIAQAVTKGLDAAAPTKPSGLQWLGDIPSHWTVLQLGMHARVGNGSTPNRDTVEYWSSGDIPWLNSSHVNRDEITDADQFVSEVATAECHLPLVGAESLLIGLTGQGRTRGMTSILRFPATINQHVAYVTPETSVWNPEYLLWSLRASYDRLRELSDENGSTKGALTCTAIKKLKIAFPPLSEQNAIAASIHEQLAGIDRIVAASTAAVELLGERRSALISAAVSGKIRIIEE